jgi:hypothetical protein
MVDTWLFDPQAQRAQSISSLSPTELSVSSKLNRLAERQLGFGSFQEARRSYTQSCGSTRTEPFVYTEREILKILRNFEESSLDVRIDIQEAAKNLRPIERLVLSSAVSGTKLYHIGRIVQKARGRRYRGDPKHIGWYWLHRTVRALVKILNAECGNECISTR